MKFTFAAKAFPVSKGAHCVVCVKDGKQRSAVAQFPDQKNADEDAATRTARAKELGSTATYIVCDYTDGTAVETPMS